jgi:hypothetical protein
MGNWTGRIERDRWITEGQKIKILVEPQGFIVALVKQPHSTLFFVTRKFVGFQRIVTNDRIVARAGYSAPGSLALIRKLYPNGV